MSSDETGAAASGGAGLHASLEHQLGPGGAESAQEDAAPGVGRVLPLFAHAEAEAAPAPGDETHDGAPAEDQAPLLDAWYGSFGTAVSRSIAQQAVSRQPGARGKPTTGEMVAESIIGTDDRVQVSGAVAKEPPYGWICSLVITAQNGTRWLGTGWLAGPRLLVTAGHCVYQHNAGGWIRDVVVRPGPSAAGGATLRTSTAFSVTGWVNEQREAADYGALVLAPEAADLGWFGFASRPDALLQGDVVNVVGFPADKPSGTMWGNSHTLLPPSADELLYVNDTYGGMSGAPVIEWDGADYAVLGIHNYGDVAGNRATRVTAEVFTNIRNWIGRAQG